MREERNQQKAKNPNQESEKAAKMESFVSSKSVKSEVLAQKLEKINKLKTGVRTLFKEKIQRNPTFVDLKT